MAVQILDKAFLILETLSLEFSGLSVSELSQRVDLNITTVHRILGDFQERGYIQQSPDKVYSLSLKFIDLSGSYLNGLELKKEAEPYLISISENLNQTVYLATLMDNQVVYIDKHEMFNSLRKYSIIGERRPLYCTALGKSLLMGFSQKERESYAESAEYKQFTENTIKDRDSLLKEIGVSCQRGWTIDNEEIEGGIICYAAPIKDYRGHIIAALSTSGFKDEILKTGEALITTALMDTAQQISLRMGYIKEDKVC